MLLSAQATDKGVNIATRRLFPVANTPAAILALGVEGLEAHIRTIGLYRSKAKHLVEACRSSSTSTAARCRATVRRSSACPASVARPRTWC